MTDKLTDRMDAKDEALYRCDQQAEAYQSQIERLDAEIERLKERNLKWADRCGTSDGKLIQANMRIAQLEEVVEAARWLTVHVPTGHIAGLTEQSKYIGLIEAIAKLDKAND